MSAHQLPRVLVPVATPFGPDLDVDPARFLAHCDELVGAGAGLALFGTTSEANSLGLDERRRVLDAVLAHGIPAVRPTASRPGSGR